MTTLTRNGQSPFYIKWAAVIVGLLAFFYIVHVGRDVLAPLLFALYFSILLNPISNFLHQKGIPRVIAIFLTVILGLAFFFGLIFFLGSQIVQFRNELPEIKTRFSELFHDVIDWVSRVFGIKTTEIKEKVNELKENGLNGEPQSLIKTLGSVSGFLIALVLVPVYTVMFLFYKPLLLDFIRRVFHHSSRETVAMVLAQTKVLIQSYLIGLMIEAAIVATIDSVGLLVIGIQHALLFGIMAAFFNLIPYVGGLLAMSLPCAMAIVSDEPMNALYVVLLFGSVQLVDNNFIIPKIVASKVKLNALVSIVAVSVGAALWGVVGMFLALPTTAILKVICDNIEGLKPVGFLLGDTMPPIGKVIFKFKTPKQEKKEASSSTKSDTSRKKGKK